MCVCGGGGSLASRLVLERETHSLGQNRQKPLRTPTLKIKDRKTACFDLPIALFPEGDKLKEADSLVFHFILSKILWSSRSWLIVLSFLAFARRLSC